MAKTYITTIQRTIASVLLISQLLTSCGGHETILPRSEQASSSSLTATALQKNDTFLTDSDSTFPLSTTTVEGPNLTFDDTPATGLQATFQDHNLSNTTPVQQDSVIQDVTLSALSIVVGHYEKKLGKDYADKATADMHAVAQTLPAVASEKEFRAVAVKSECAAGWYEYAAQLCLTAKKVWDPQLRLGERPLVILNRLATQQRVNAVIAYTSVADMHTAAGNQGAAAEAHELAAMVYRSSAEMYIITRKNYKGASRPYELAAEAYTRAGNRLAAARMYDAAIG